ncbi:Uma2 family endonuclease [Alkalinema pantanalense CENA528]|uniref:Uma2 family endonuclease n=1 Tax=Alkalinema pantanalense TaxID=1620705 RepID=UPI003D6F7A8E
MDRRCYPDKTWLPTLNLAIEVVLTSSLIDKLDIYRGLGVTEVWVWEAEQFRIYHLREAGYEQVAGSELLPNCDVQMLASYYVKLGEQLDAVMAYWDSCYKGDRQTINFLHRR